MKKGVAIVFTIVAFSCTLQSKFSLPNNQNIDANLIGNWIHYESPNDTIVIDKKNEKSYHVVIDNCNQTTAFSYKINNYNIMTLIDDNNHLFYGFDCKGDSLKIMKINKALRHEDFNSQKDLIYFFKNHINDSNFFLEPIYLIKQK